MLADENQLIGNDYDLAEQADFYQKYLPLIEPNLIADDVRVRSIKGYAIISIFKTRCNFGFEKKY